MTELLEKVVNCAKQHSLVPSLSPDVAIPVPGINKVELYLSFHGNDHCSHCITCSGPHRTETMHPDSALRLIDAIARYSVLSVLPDRFGKGRVVFYGEQAKGRLDKRRKPSKPVELFDSIDFNEYADCLMGKNEHSMWIQGDRRTELPMGRPSIRISGGEFFTWPHIVGGDMLSTEQRLVYQRLLLDAIRTRLPAYDIWILTNGRFAESDEAAVEVLRHWAPASGKGGTERVPTRQVSAGKTRICVSVDPFHKPPKNSTRDEMVDRIWKAASICGLGAPYLYGIPNRRVFLLGRALENYLNGGPAFFEGYEVDAVDLRKTNGCNELKGFIVNTPKGGLPVNNIVVNYDGHLSYCCACVGDYGNFLEGPENTLRNLIRDPVACVLRKGESAEKFLGMAAEMDPSIAAVGASGGKALGSICYQLLSGKRMNKNNDRLYN